MLTSGLVRHDASHGRRAHPEASERYESYRRRQARGLLSLVPRDGIRPLYRRALEAGFARDGGSDPMETMVRYCETLLPLPPFDAWFDDQLRNPTAYLYDVDASAEAPTAQAPVTVESRDFSHDQRPWTAHLRSFRDGVAWRGFIAFEDLGSSSVHRTALIFRESDPVDVRDRFMGFESAALVAFLRSALP